MLNLILSSIFSHFILILLYCILLYFSQTSKMLNFILLLLYKLILYKCVCLNLI